MHATTILYVHTVTTITLTVMRIIKHAADKIVTDGVHGYVGNSCIPCVFKQTHETSIIIMMLENSSLHAYF